MNIPVKFSIAKLLKANGFNLKVVNFYNYEKISLISDKDRQVEGLVNYNPINWNFVREHYTSAPTIAEVVMWLYEKYGIWIEANLSISEDFRYTIMTHSKLRIILKMSEANFKTPTEAYEAAIEYSLNEILKQK